MSYCRTIGPLALLITATTLLAPMRTLAQPSTAPGGENTGSGKAEVPAEKKELRLQPVMTRAQPEATAQAHDEVRIPGAYTLVANDYRALPLVKTNRELEAKKLGARDGDTIVLFSKRCSGRNRDQEVDCNDAATFYFEPCDSFTIEEGKSTDIRPVNVFCNQTGYLIHGGLVAVERGGGDYAPLAQIPERTAPVMGTDAGIALTIMKDNDSGKGYEFFEGATAYYSLTRMKTPLVRLVANLSALDMDPKKDFETGLGFGLLFRTPGAIDDPDNMGPAFLIGGGYNFMLDSGRDTDNNKKEPWYWFIGFSWNFDRAPS